MDQHSYDSFSDQGLDDPAAQRGDTRDSLLLVANLRLGNNGNTVQVRVRNLSAGGLMAEIASHVDVGLPVEVEVRGLGNVPGRIAWVAAGRIGVAFDHLIDPQAARKPIASKEPAKAKPIRPLF